MLTSMPFTVQSLPRAMLRTSWTLHLNRFKVSGSASLLSTHILTKLIKRMMMHSNVSGNGAYPVETLARSMSAETRNVYPVILFS